ncbi:MAG: Tat pathway signal sequence domain protein [Selenomonas sp.]|uniref:Tat pathway signal sequence domain protein n=1 Tax=Selenomonas sp. TaxID=2053611 RepID=UPI0025E64A85|nr:Tat pathway signal sequence domain protein [Selenomonas sp.]MCR5757935.1 Tat pathway signal sequence domain protein [Selenomonas sp.]
MRKKILAGVVAGAMLVGTGFGILGGQAQAADMAVKGSERQAPPMMRGPRGGHHPMMNMNADDVAKNLHETFGVSESEVKDAISAKRDFQDIGQAAMLAKISGKSFKDVLALKTQDKNWPQIGKELGVTPEQIHQQMDEMTADRMASRGDIDKAAALALLNKGYRPHDIGMAAKLAKLSGKDIQSVLDMKKINNRWGDVAEQLGVDMGQLRPEAPQGGPQGGPPPADDEPDMDR